MNIFVLDLDPKRAAQMQCDKHVVKMIVETAQILSTVQHMNGMVGPYRPTHAKHPCTVWAGTSVANYNWLLAHGIELCNEYTRRYKKIHKCQSLFEQNFNTVPELRGPATLTPFAQAMPDQYRRENTVEAYRQYYIHEKARIAKWNYSETPDWFLNHS
jgi:hypothetical protein